MKFFDNARNELKSCWNSLNKSVVVSQRELVLGVAAAALGGLVAGIFLSPKAERTVGSYNGCNNTACCPDDSEEA